MEGKAPDGANVFRTQAVAALHSRTIAERINAAKTTKAKRLRITSIIAFIRDYLKTP